MDEKEMRASAQNTKRKNERLQKAHVQELFVVNDVGRWVELGFASPHTHWDRNDLSRSCVTAERRLQQLQRTQDRHGNHAKRQQKKEALSSQLKD